MARILIIAEHSDGIVNSSTAKCVACAAEIADASIDVAVFAENGETIASEVAALASVDKVIRVDHSANTHALAAVIAPQVVALAEGYSHVLGNPPPPLPERPGISDFDHLETGRYLW